MIIAIRIAALVIGVAGVFGAAPGMARERAHNWMREYVELRREAAVERALGPQRAAELRAPVSPRIVGGSYAKPGSHPFQVALLKKSIAGDLEAQFCGGTLILPNVVVTAAHCSDFLPGPGAVQVLTGTQRLDGSGTRHDVVEIRIHPNFHPRTLDSDVAVWILSTNADGIPFAALAGSDPDTGTSLLATGWGDTENASGYPIRLREANLPRVSRRNCNDANSYRGAVSRNMICAGLDAGGADTCSGDSGGPLTRRRNGGFTILVGITSWGEGCADPNLFGVYTRVSRFRSWILSQLD